MLNALRVVLVEPSHPGNIGAVARSMWTMGLTRLVLVKPKIFPSAEATARAAGADELLYRARVCDDLASAIEGCGYVTATTARKRRLELPVLTPREWGGRFAEQAVRTEAALVFGRESSGLNNGEIDLCHALAKIPANEAYASLNLASAVQLFAYEARQAWLGAGGEQPALDGEASQDRPATADELAGFYEHLEQTLVQIGYLDPENPKLLMRRLRRLFGRTQIEQPEVNILRGILAVTQRVARGGRKGEG
ncbi:MAG: RNA methyltransferase [Gammaproteobacteria bacterium]